jgi:hypothetical protein
MAVVNRTNAENMTQNFDSVISTNRITLRSTGDNIKITEIL